MEVSGAVRPIYGSLGVKQLITVQLDETTSSLFIILQVHSTCFGCQPYPSPGVHKTVTTVSGTVQPPPSNVVKLAWPRWMEEAVQKIRPVSEAVVTILCTPYEGCGWHPKLVERTCKIINRLLCVTSRWTVINRHILFVILWVLHRPTIHSCPRIFENSEVFYNTWILVLSSVFYMQTVNVQKT